MPIAAFSASAAKETAPAILYGDVNGDLGVNANDVILLRKYLANFNYDTLTSSVAVERGADVNGDGVINANDVLIFRKYIANYNYATGSSTVVLGPQSPSTDLDSVNFNGTKLIIGLNLWENPGSISALSGIDLRYIWGPDEYTLDSAQNAVYDRNRKVTNKLGLDISYCTNELAPGQALTFIENFVLADMDDAPDILHAPAQDMLRAGIKGLLHNTLTEEEGVNYFDFKEENGWYTDYMLENTLDESKIFLLAGDYFIDVLRYTYAALVNIDMYDTLFLSEGGIDSLYEKVLEGNWTYDEFMRCADAAYIDSGSIGYVDEADTFGIVAGYDYCTTLLATSGINIFEEVDGKTTYARNVTNLSDFTDNIIELSNRYAFFNPRLFATNEYDPTAHFISGKSLFALDQYISNIEGENIRKMDDKVGLLPYPKYDKNEEYRSLVSNTADIGGILYNSDKFSECSALLQMMTEESNGGAGTLVYEYYDVMLKCKYCEDPMQAEMLDIIRNGICSPRQYLFDSYFASVGNFQPLGNVIANAAKNCMNTIHSYWSMKYTIMRRVFDNTYNIYGVQN